MGKEVWKFVYDNYHRFGYKSHSLMIEDCVIDAIKNKFHDEVSEEQLEHLKAYEKVGKIADNVKPLAFIGRASKTYKAAEKEYNVGVKLGFMTEEQREKSLKRLRKKLRKSVQTTIKDQEKRETEERAKRKKAFLKKRGYKVTKGGKIKRKA
jgi:uncharacterized Ntn-hydrolase superfamily protein